MLCTQIVFFLAYRTYITCSELGIFMSLTRNLMNNLLSYYGSVDARISASEKWACLKAYLRVDGSYIFIYFLI